jgi:hypothetical protein
MPTVVSPNANVYIPEVIHQRRKNRAFQTMRRPRIFSPPMPPATGSVERAPSEAESAKTTLPDYETRMMRYSALGIDGLYHAEVVDSAGTVVKDGIGTADGTLADLLLYLLPPDHPDQPVG